MASRSRDKANAASDVVVNLLPCMYSGPRELFPINRYSHIEYHSLYHNIIACLGKAPDSQVSPSCETSAPLAEIEKVISDDDEDTRICILPTSIGDLTNKESSESQCKSIFNSLCRHER